MRRSSQLFYLGLGLACIAGLLWLGARRTTESLGRPGVVADAGDVARGAAAFEGAGLGGVGMAPLESNAVPWRLVAAALVLDEQRGDPDAKLDRATLDRILARFGFLIGAQVVNRPAGVEPPAPEMPLGFTYGDVEPVGGLRIRVANLGCAACHAGVTYDPTGAPRPGRVALGMPNSSLDLEAYTMAIFHALRRFARSDRLLAAADALFPEMSWSERLTLRFFVRPLAKHRLSKLAGVDRPLPFPNGGPGSTNGVAALKAALGIPLIGDGLGDAGVVSIPDLGDRVWRTSLLADGAYAVPTRDRQSVTKSSDVDARHLRDLAVITTFFSVPSMGVHPDRAAANLGDAAEIMAFLKDYRPQDFPGPVDPDAASRGATIYARDCAMCHGSYADTDKRARLVSFPNWIGNVGTDPLRAAAFDGRLATAIAGTAYRDRIAVASGNSYAAPPLTGIWASAPYLHNGSVPTLTALLSPETRPDGFMVGGHALDFGRVGLRLTSGGGYPEGHVPFARPAWIDTRMAGYGNGGHRYGEALSEADKNALLEYLKLL